MAESSAKKPATKKTSTKKPVAKKPVQAKKSVKATSTRNKKDLVSNNSSSKNTEKIAEVSTAIKNIKDRVVTPIAKLKRLHQMNVVFGVVLAIICMFFVKNDKIDLLLSYQAKDNFLISQPTTLGPVSDFFVSVSIKYMLVAVLALTVLVSLLLITKLFRKYQSGIDSSISVCRWLAYGVISGMLVVFASVLGGVQDVMTLKMVGIMVVVSSLFAIMAERENKYSKDVKKLGVWLSIISMLLALTPLVVSMVATTVISGERFGWHVYTILVVIIAGWIANSWNLRRSIVKKNDYKYINFENRYVRIDQVVKLTIIFVIFLAMNTNTK